MKQTTAESRKEYVLTLRELVFSLLSKKEREIVLILGGSGRPLSLKEIDEKTSFSYGRLIVLVRRLQRKHVVTCHRSAIKVVTLNEALVVKK